MDLTDRSSHFEFGQNWLSYSRTIDDQKIAEAERSIEQLLRIDLRGKSFLDVGPGSGLFSLAAMRLGARPLHAIDIDENSVAATRALLEARAPSSDWRAERASILDADAARGEFDVVYSWGVLHHTGRMWRAIEQAAARVRTGGLLAIALYRKTRLCPLWTVEKRLYTQYPRTFAPLANLTFKTAWTCAQLLVGRNPVARIRSYHSTRGMSWSHDVHDWLGGYPYESTSPEELMRVVANLGLKHVRSNVRPGTPLGLFGSGCNEYVFQRS
jgi:2-polyprenyl-6-hydroxyphenyl methylase/3-demethylubiquinone-9 3-methyltransferase